MNIEKRINQLYMDLNPQGNLFFEYSNIINKNKYDVFWNSMTDIRFAITKNDIIIGNIISDKYGINDFELDDYNWENYPCIPEFDIFTIYFNINKINFFKIKDGKFEKIC